MKSWCGAFIAQAQERDSGEDEARRRVHLHRDPVGGDALEILDVAHPAGDDQAAANDQEGSAGDTYRPWPGVKRKP